MQDDVNLKETLQNTCDKLQLFFDNNQYGPEHRELILKHEKLSDSILKLNIVAIEKQSTNLTILHEDFKAIKKEVDTAMAEINNVIDNLDKAVKITNILGKAVSFISK